MDSSVAILDCPHRGANALIALGRGIERGQISNRVADRVFEQECPARLARLADSLPLLRNYYFRGHDEHRVIARSLPALVEDLLWAELAFDRLSTVDRLTVALVAAEVTGCLWTFFREPPLTRISRVHRLGTRFGRAVWDEFPGEASYALCRLAHCSPTPKAEAWTDPLGLLLNPAHFAAHHRAFSVARDFAVEVPGESGRVEYLTQSLSLSRVLIQVVHLKGAELGLHETRERIGAADLRHWVEYHCQDAFIAHRRGDQAAAIESLGRAEELAARQFGGMHHFSQADLIRLRFNIRPDSVRLSELLQANALYAETPINCTALVFCASVS